MQISTVLDSDVNSHYDKVDIQNHLQETIIYKNISLDDTLQNTYIDHVHTLMQ